MKPVPPSLLLALLVLGTTASAQSWTLASSGPAQSFGVAGDLLVRDNAGALGFDEVAAATLLPAGAGWTALPATPSSRQFAALAAGSRAYLFGGITAAGLASDVWSFDRAQGDWVAMAPGFSAGPSPRAGCKAAAYGGWPLVFFGGFDANGLPADAWVMLDVAGAALWSPLAVPPAMVGRTHHAMAPGPQLTVLLFGGLGAAGPLGDTWVFDGASWLARSGPGPAPAGNCRMAYDAGRDMVVMAHPNGETWEWNGFHWRRVGVTTSPAWLLPALLPDPVLGSVTAWQRSGASLDAYRFTPSLAEFQITSDAVCVAATSLSLDAFERSLPVLGQTLHLRASGMFPNALFVGVYELSVQSSSPLGCGCVLGVTGVAAGLQFVPGVGAHRDWLLPIANLAALNGVPVDVQGVVVDAQAPCFVMTTQRGTLVPGS